MLKETQFFSQTVELCQAGSMYAQATYSLCSYGAIHIVRCKNRILVDTKHTKCGLTKQMLKDESISSWVVQLCQTDSVYEQATYSRCLHP